MSAFAATIPGLEEAWSSTVAQWSEPSAHDELFRLAHAHDAWVWVARRYRDYAKTHVGDPIAARQLRRVQCFLMAALAPRDKPTKNPYRATVSVLVMFLIALGIGTLFTRMGFSAVTANQQSTAWEVGTEVAPVVADEVVEVAPNAPTHPLIATVR